MIKSLNESLQLDKFPDPRVMHHAVFDIDGTLFNCEHRMHYLYNEEGNLKHDADWDGYHKAHMGDSLIVRNAAILRALYAVDYRINLLTGRSDKFAESTMAQLDIFKIPYHSLRMRPEGNRFSNAALKAYQLKTLNLGGHNIIAFFDDNKKVIDMLRKKDINGILVGDAEY